MVHEAGTDNANVDSLSRYPVPSTNGALVLEWTGGEIMVLATCFSMMAGAAIPLHATEEEKEIWDDVEVLRLLQTHAYGNGLIAKTRDCIYRYARSYR